MKLKKITFKTLSLMLVFAMVVPMFAFAAEPWDVPYYDGKEDDSFMAMEPVDGYVSMQNPPSFFWGRTDSYNGSTYTLATYDFQIAKDESFSDIVYSKTNLTGNYHLPSKTLDKGIHLYWRVRYHFNGSTSTWSTVRKFKISDNAIEFLLPSKDVMLSKIPTTHPRIWTTKEKLSEFRNYKNTSPSAKIAYDTVIANADRYVSLNEIYAEPTIVQNPSSAVVADAHSKANTNMERAYWCAFAYLLTGGEAYADYAKRAALSFLDWDAENGYTTPKHNIQITRMIMLYGARVYDWIYDTLTPTEITQFHNMLRPRIEDLTVYNGGITKYPLNSMGWSGFSYLLASCIALYGDMPEANQYLNDYIEFFCTRFPNWTYQDGGWSQGTAYSWWSTSLASEFASEMSTLGIANVYENVWGQNSFKWNLYQMPANSSGNFGDGTQQGHDLRVYMLLNNLHEMNFNEDGNNGYRKWLAEQAGGMEKFKVRLDAYYLAPKYDSVKAVKPTDLPLSNHFYDSGVYSMMSDLSDVNRIHFTLRASDYGTSVHSMQQQNAFFLTAFNKDLAVRSGYYDSYLSPHHANITRNAFANNTITVDNEYQIPDSFSSDGKILSFVNHLDFDTATSDATDAYTSLDNFDRSVIYIRPDIFVIVDELDAKGNNSSVFKWWLNAPVPITDNGDTKAELTPTTSASSPEIAGKKEARITNGNAVLTAKAVYPATSLRYYKGFIDPITFQQYDSTLYQDEFGVQNRICFNTAPLQKTVMVTSLSVFETTGSEKQATVTYYDDYVKLSYLGGETVVLVNITDNNAIIQAEAEGIEFQGTAVTYNDNTIMLTNGKYLKKDGKEIVKSSNGNVSVALGLGEFAISSSNAFTTVFGDVRDYVTITEASKLTDRNGVGISSKIGISPSINNVDGTVTLTADAGDYVVFTDDDGIVNPSQMSVDDVKFQKSGDGKAAIFWTPKNSRLYDIKIDGAVVYDLNTSPYVFTLNPANIAEKNVSSIRIREKIGHAISPWSEPIFISSFDDEKHDIVKFTQSTESDKTFINATTTGFPSFDVFDMYLANYDKDGKLIGAVKGAKSGNIFSAKAPLISDGTHKTLLFGPNLKPLSTTATYGTNDTKLKGIYIDGKPLDTYSDNVNSYQVTIPKGSVLFPYVSAVAKDNTTSTSVKYNFDDLTAKIYVTSASGAQRVIDIKFKNTRENIHVVVDPATGNIPTFIRDTLGYGIYRPQNDERETNISQSNVATVTFKRTDPSTLTNGEPTVYNHTVQLPISTNFKPYEGGFRWGAKVFNNRAPYNSNYMQILDVDEDLIGYDYIVPLHNDMFGYAESGVQTLSDMNVKFKVNQDSEVVVVSRTKATGLEQAGWRVKDVDMQAIYSMPVGAEDWFYNVILCNRPYTDTVTDQQTATTDNQRLDNYTIYKEWVNVAPITSVIANATDFASKIQAYKNAGLTKADFAEAGSCYDNYIIGGTTWKYKYTYTMDFPAGDVSIDLDHCTTFTAPFVLVVRPKTPKPLTANDNITIKTHTEYKGDPYTTDLKIKDDLAWFCEAENYLTPATGINVYSTRNWLSGGKAVQYFRTYGSEMTYNVDVPEDGYYNFVVKYVAWGADGLPLREISFNNNDNKTYTFTPYQTQSFGGVPEDWAACELDCGIYLKAGANVLTIKALNSGYWNIDWVGLIKQ